jgi:two-component system chemotaxis sensor kinase CheA
MPVSEEELLQELMSTFQVEADEHLQTLNQTLLQLERQPDETERQELLRTAFRAAHSLKGAARAVGLDEIEKLSHALESVLESARDANLTLDANTCDILYDSLDLTGQLLGGAATETGAVQAQLDALASAETLSEQTPDPIPEPLPKAKPVAAAPTTPGVPTPPTAGPPGEAQTIRVAVQKLDDLMAQAGELLVSKINAEQRLVELQDIQAQLEAWPKLWRDMKNLFPRVTSTEGDAGHQLTERLDSHNQFMQNLIRFVSDLQQAMHRDTTTLGMVSSELQNVVRRVRMVPFQTLSLGLQRTVRDLARSEGKGVNFVIQGEWVEMDKTVLESLKDPLTHLLNNAVMHGIEQPTDRQKAGKPLEGHITVTARQRGSEVHIDVQDDGAGFDLEALCAASVERGGPALPEDASEEQLVGLAFMPGITTAGKVTTRSGRGVGLDIVRQTLAAMQGRIRVETSAQGTTIRLVVPASLAMARGLLVRVGRAHYVLPLLSVDKIEEPRDIFAVEGRYMLPVEGWSLPLVPLAAILKQQTNGSTPFAKMMAVIVTVAEQRVALLVDEVLDELELAVKPLGKPLRHTPNVAGAALLGTGEPVIVLNPTDLIQSVRGSRINQAPIAEAPPENNRNNAHILVVDDSITTRTLEKNILQAAGFRVTTATDGLEALQQLEAHVIDVIVADVQMPNMDGIAFTRAVRDSAEFREKPVILVTSLESREDRERGMLAGADAYIIKRGFDQAELLATIEQFL